MKSQFLGLLGPKPTPTNHDPGGYDIRAAVPAWQRSSPPRCNNTGVSTPPGHLPGLLRFFRKKAQKIEENHKFGPTTRHTDRRRRDIQTEFWAVWYGSGSLS